MKFRFKDMNIKRITKKQQLNNYFKLDVISPRLGEVIVEDRENDIPLIPENCECE